MWVPGADWKAVLKPPPPMSTSGISLASHVKVAPRDTPVIETLICDIPLASSDVVRVPYPETRKEHLTAKIRVITANAGQQKSKYKMNYFRALARAPDDAQS